MLVLVSWLPERATNALRRDATIRRHGEQSNKRTFWAVNLFGTAVMQWCVSRLCLCVKSYSGWPGVYVKITCDREENIR